MGSEEKNQVTKAQVRSPVDQPELLPQAPAATQDASREWHLGLFMRHPWLPPKGFLNCQKRLVNSSRDFPRDILMRGCSRSSDKAFVLQSNRKHIKYSNKSRVWALVIWTFVGCRWQSLNDCML